MKSKTVKNKTLLLSLLLISSLVAFNLYFYNGSSSISSPSDSSLRSQTEINVVFEEAHSPIAPIIWPCGCPGTYSGFADYLIENGYTVSTINPGTVITSSILSSVDILVIVAPQQEYDPSELDAIEAWVKNGGSLLLISEEHCLGNIAASIAERFGIEFEGFALVDIDDKVNCKEVYFYLNGGNINEHEITSRVSRVEVYAADGIISDTSDTSLLLTMDEDDTARWANCTPAEGVPLMIAMEGGNVDAGKLVTITDSSLWRNDTDTDCDGELNLWDSDNEILALDTIKWLEPSITENVPPSTPTLFDPGLVDDDGEFLVDWGDSVDPDGFVSYYVLEMASDQDFSNVLQSWTPSVSEQFVSDLSEGDYYFRVMAVDDDDASSGWSNLEDITVEFPPENVAPSVPVLYDLAEVDYDGEFLVDWGDSVDPDGFVSYYVLEMASDQDFSNVLQSWTLSVSEQFVTGLDDGIYFFRVMAVDDDDASSGWSNVEDITVETIIPQSEDGGTEISLPVLITAFLVVIGLGVGIVFSVIKHE